MLTIKIKLLLNKIYAKKINIQNIDKEYLNTKLKHSFKVYKIAKKINRKLANKYPGAFILHDIGRFYKKDSKNFNHAEFGYKFLTKLNLFDNFTLLPILYHESDLNWKELIHNSCKLHNMTVNNIELTSSICSLLKDADLIANMLGILEEKVQQKTPETNISYTNINNFMNNKICNSQLIPKKHFDKIIYILCGLSIINLPESKELIKNKRLVSRLITKAKQILPQDDKKLNLIINKIKLKAFTDGWLDTNILVIFKKRWKHTDIPNCFTEIGIDPDNNKFLLGISSEIEFLHEKYEIRTKGFIKMQIKEFFIRIWILNYSISIGTGEIEIINKRCNNFKILFGIAGIK